MTSNRQWLGRYGEDRACDYLSKLGYQIVERNARSRDGELDIVATDGSTLVFVEVKTRSSRFSGHPFQAITPLKVARIRRLAAGWCASRQLPNSQVRFDAISVLVQGGQVAIEHLRQVA